MVFFLCRHLKKNIFHILSKLSFEDFDNIGDVIIPLSITTNSLDIIGCIVQSDDKLGIGGQMTLADFIDSNMLTLRVFTYDVTSGINEEVLKTLQVYPNSIPTYFILDDMNVEQVHLCKVMDEKVYSWDASMRYELPNGIEAGIYYIQAINKIHPTVTKVIIK